MRALNLEYLPVRRSYWAGVLVLAGGVAAMLAMASSYLELQGDISRQTQQVAKLQGKDRAPKSSTYVAPRTAEQLELETRQANAAIMQLSLPWKDLFEAFEGSRSSEVAVLAIEPDVQKAQVLLQAEAKNMKDILQYVDKLQKNPLFREVVLLNHQIQDQDPEKPIRFELQAAWEIRR